MRHQELLRREGPERSGPFFNPPPKGERLSVSSTLIGEGGSGFTGFAAGRRGGRSLLCQSLSAITSESAEVIKDQRLAGFTGAGSQRLWPLSADFQTSGIFHLNPGRKARSRYIEPDRAERGQACEGGRIVRKAIAFGGKADGGAIKLLVGVFVVV
jgi:hypothetical protein